MIRAIALTLLVVILPIPAAAWPPSWVADSSTANVLRSTDQGATWQLMGQYRGAAPGTNLYISMTVNASNHLFVAETWTTGTTETFGVYKSTDQGSTWTPLTTPAPQDLTTGIHYYEPAITSDVNNRLLLMLQVGPYCAGITATERPRTYRSTDGGGTWSYVGQPSVPSAPWYPFPGVQSTPGPSNGFCAMTSTLSGHTVATSAYVYQASCAGASSCGLLTYDYGATWTCSSAGAGARALATDPYNNLYHFNGSVTGNVNMSLYRYQGGGLGSVVNLGTLPLLGSYPVAAAADNLGVVFCASAATGLVYKSLDMGANWTAAGSFSTTVWSTASIAMAGDIALLPSVSPTPTPAAVVQTSAKPPFEGTFRLHPNPLRGRDGSISFSFRPAERAVITIISAAGEWLATVSSHEVEASKGRGRWSAQVSDRRRLARGTYLAVLSTERGREAVRFAVAKE